MYTATITRNFMDMQRTPKVLFINIIDENGELFRDHCWVSISKKIKDFIPSHNKLKNIITFEARIKEYQTIGPKKKTLCSIKEIKLIDQIRA